MILRALSIDASGRFVASWVLNYVRTGYSLRSKLIMSSSKVNPDFLEHLFAERPPAVHLYIQHFPATRLGAASRNGSLA